MNDVVEKHYCADCGSELDADDAKYLGDRCNGCELLIGGYSAEQLESSRSPGCSTRRFPMQHGPDIDWTTAEKIYAMYSALYGTQQSLERLAQRGGFGWKEVEVIQAEYNKRARR